MFFSGLGYQWASFLLAGLALILMPFRKYIDTAKGPALWHHGTLLTGYFSIHILQIWQADKRNKSFCTSTVEALKDLTARADLRCT